MGEPGERLLCCASKPDPAHDRPAGQNVRGKCMYSTIYFQHDSKYFVARDIPGRVLENNEVLQELAEQIITKVAYTEKCRTILRGDHGIFFCAVFFYLFIITIPKFLTLFSVTKFSCNEDISFFQRFPCTECVCLTQN